MTILNLRPGSPTTGGITPGNSAIIEVDERNFQQEVLERSRTVPIVIDFWAPWCGPCKTLGPILEKLATEAKGTWILAKVNVDNNQRLAQAFGVQGIPAVKAVKDGKLINEFTGAIPESQVRAWLKKFVPASAEQIAEDLVRLEAQNPQAAEKHYRDILAKDATQDDAHLGLGRLLLAAHNAEAFDHLRAIKLGSPAYAQAQAWLTLAEYMATIQEEDAFQLLSQVDTDPANLEARYQLTAHLIQGQRYEQAIDHLLEIVARNRSFREDAGRKLLVALFMALGDQNPFVVSGRKRLANLLF